MEELLLEILDALRHDGEMTPRELAHIIDVHNSRAGDAQRRYAKKKILPYYLRVKEEEPIRWESWHVDEALEKRLLALCRMKPRRSASGVATITVITPPWPCSGDCLYCPNDIRMPKSYLHDEPACQRAERNFFDPYLQVSARLRALMQMGHPCDKVELIVLGGSWTDYPASYQVWFMTELFSALNDAASNAAKQAARRKAYLDAGLSCDPVELSSASAALQARIEAGELSYNDAVNDTSSRRLNVIEESRSADYDALDMAQRANETASCRCVGLVVETRPAAITGKSLLALRRYGC